VLPFHKERNLKEILRFVIPLETSGNSESEFLKISGISRIPEIAENS